MCGGENKVSIEKIYSGARGQKTTWKTMWFRPLPWTAFPLGFGLLLGPDPLARSPSRTGLGHFSAQDGPRPPTKVPRAVQDRQQRPRERPKTAYRGPRAAQDRPQRPQERPKTAHISPKSCPRPLMEGLRATQDRPQRPQERPKTALIGPKSGPRPPTEALQLHIRPPIENIEEKYTLTKHAARQHRARRLNDSITSLCRCKATGPR